MARDELAGQRALKHGGGAGEVAITRDTPFTGLASEMEKHVTDELEVDGLTAIVKRDAIRLQTVADLYYAAILGADNLEKFDAYVKRYGWICASALRAWQQVREIEKAKGVDITAVLKSYEGKNDTD